MTLEIASGLMPTHNNVSSNSVHRKSGPIDQGWWISSQASGICRPLAQWTSKVSWEGFFLNKIQISEELLEMNILGASDNDFWASTLQL